MNPFVHFISWLLTNLFSCLLWPFQKFNPIWALVFVSWLSGILMLWIFGKVSNQQAIGRVRDRIRGNLLGVRLYQHELRVVLQLQGSILRDTLSYMRYSLIPMLVLILPVGLILAQLNLRFALRPLEPGHPALVKVKLRDSVQRKEEINLETPATIKVETPGVYLMSEKEIAWRIRAERPGYYSLKIRTRSDDIEKELWVGEGWGAVSPLRTAHLGELLLYPGEPPINLSELIESIEVKYPVLNLSLFGWRVHWLVLFLFFSIIFGFAFKRVLGVEI
jgi:hypothetical protein